MSEAKPAISATRFYQYLGAHSFLIGLLPFFIPVYLWRIGYNLAHLSLLIGVSGISFCLVLAAWQHAARYWPLPRLIALTFAIEIALIALLTILDGSAKILLLLGVANGVYNAFFWTTQRTLFIEITTNSNTGRQYGNFQIFVTVFLKVGLLVGGFLLDAGGLLWLLLLSTVVALVASLAAYNTLGDRPLDQFGVVTLKDSLQFDDKHHSRRVFLIDGLFLYLESHFWTLSLFLLVNEDYSSLGLTVILLAVAFSLIFYAIKNTIDRYSGANIYTLAVILYAGSWLLRALITPETPMHWILTLLVLITFCSSFFRLAFNKRFFDIAKQSAGTRYLLIKSYTSQLVLGLAYLGLAAGLFMYHQGADFSAIYIVAAIFALLYFAYGQKELNKDKQQ